MKNSCIIVALDYDNADEALNLMLELQGMVYAYKVGMELRANEPLILDDLPEDTRVFYDQKLKDIPNTVAGTVRAFVRDGVWMLNVHVDGSKAMMEAAVKAAEEEAQKQGTTRPLIIGVTLLTSINQEALETELCVNMTTKEHVVHLAKLAQEAGLDGVVASPEETALIRSACGPDFLIVNPGIRPAGSEVHDQKRVGTPTSAILNGADYLVIGRPITAAPDPIAATKAINKEINSALLYKDVAESIFRDKGIEFGEFRLKSHKRWPGAPPSPIFINLRVQGLCGEHDGRLTGWTIDKIGELIGDRYGELIAHLPEYIAAIPNAAEPIVDAIMENLPEGAQVKRLYLEKVGTGDSRTIALKESQDYLEGASVLLVDDLITKADSKIEAAEVLRKAGMVVELCLVVVDRQQGGPEEAEAAGLKVISIFTLDELLDLYLLSGLITKEQVNEIRTYKDRFEEYTRTHPPV